MHGAAGMMHKERNFNNIRGHKAMSYRCEKCFCEMIWAEDERYCITDGGDWEEVDPW